MSNLATIRDILTAHSDELIDTLAHHIAYLGARPEWTPEDNYAVTEGLFAAAATWGLPHPDGNNLYIKAAREVGYDDDDLGIDGES